jgi:murein DD-endopeptidase MepM/ murein hydrolase activator NlpD
MKAENMKLIVLGSAGRAARCLDLSAYRSWVASGALVAVLATAGAIGYSIADARAGLVNTDEVDALRVEISSQREQLALLNTSADEHIDALALRMGQLNANVIRLNALGGRLTGMAKLDDGEFDFSNSPALGGPADADLAIEAGEGQLPELLASMGSLEETLDAQEQQLAALEALMLNRKLNERVSPSGRPVKKGWMSSYFGRRTDPVNGKSAYHRGIDFAGKYGNEVIAVGDGVVSWSGDRYGFGNLVEVKHGNGYLTRYAHNQENLVAVGDKVSQGETIALMGSTGRSTGPHVHFEVWRNGAAVDPAKYIRSN